MGGILGGNGTSTQRQTSNNNQTWGYTPSSGAMGLDTNALNMIQQAANTPYSPITQQIAQLTPEQLQGINTINSAYTASQPYMKDAAKLFQDAAGPISASAINQFYQPYAGAVGANLAETFKEQMRDLTGNLAQTAGGYGADRIAVGQDEALRQNQLAAGQTFQQIYMNSANLLQQQKAQEAASAMGLGNLGSANVAAILGTGQAQMGAGGLEQQTQQAALNAQYTQQLQQLGYPFEVASWIAQNAMGMSGAMGGTGTGATQGLMKSAYTPPPPNVGSELAGLGLAGVKIASMLPMAARGGAIRKAFGGAFSVNPPASPNAFGGASMGNGNAFGMNPFLAASPPKMATPPRPGFRTAVLGGGPGFLATGGNVKGYAYGGSPYAIASGRSGIDASGWVPASTPMGGMGGMNPMMMQRMMMGGMGGMGGMPMMSGMAGMGSNAGMDYNSALQTGENWGSALGSAWDKWGAALQGAPMSGWDATTTPAKRGGPIKAADGASIDQPPSLLDALATDIAPNGIFNGPGVTNEWGSQQTPWSIPYGRGARLAPMAAPKPMMLGPMETPSPAASLDSSSIPGITTDISAPNSPVYDSFDATPSGGPITPYGPLVSGKVKPAWAFGTQATGAPVSVPADPTGQYTTDPNGAALPPSDDASVAGGDPRTYPDSLATGNQKDPYTEGQGGASGGTGGGAGGWAGGDQRSLPDAIMRYMGPGYQQPSLFGKPISNMDLAEWAGIAGLIGGRSPYFGVNLGNAMGQGVGTLKAFQEMDAQRASRAMEAYMQQQGLDIRGQELELQQEMKPLQIGQAMYDHGFRTGNQNEMDMGLQIMKNQGIEPGDKSSIATKPEDYLPQVPSTEFGDIHAPKAYLPDTQTGDEQARNRMLDQSKKFVEASDASVEKESKANILMSEMRHQFSLVPDKDSFLSPGSMQKARLALAKGINTMRNVMGLDPAFDPNDVANSEALWKNTTWLGYGTSSMMGSREAVQIVQGAIAANPGLENTPLGFRVLQAGIQAGYDRNKDWNNFLHEFQANNRGDINQAKEMFQKYRPEAYYSRKATIMAKAMDAVANGKASQADMSDLLKSKGIDPDEVFE